jgi:lipoprotein-releasing system permease protein
VLLKKYDITHITNVVNAVQELFHINFVSEELFMIGFVPSSINFGDVAWICGLSLLMSIIATIYPAWRASNIKPAEALRYE